MLCELHIANVAIIEELRIEFSSGLHMISGETGAGKSIILGALGLILGGRGDVGLIREGAKEASVQARFQIDEMPWVAETLLAVGLEPESDLVIRRVVSRNGRSRVHVNGCPVTVRTLKRLARGLVDFSSQHEQQVLLDSARHLGILDDVGTPTELLSAMARSAAELNAIGQDLAQLDALRADRAERLAFLRFQVDELNRVSPRLGEDDELEAERKRLSHAERLRQNSEAAEALLYSDSGAAVERLGEALSRVESIAAIDPSLEGLVESLAEALAHVEDAARSLSAYGRGVESRPERLDEIGARLDVLSDLKRKFRLNLPELISRQSEMQSEIFSLENFDEARGHLEADLAKARQVAEEHAGRLSEARRSSARLLEEAVHGELKSLSMAAARFRVHIASSGADQISADGWDRVEFFLAANPGEPARPMNRVASGGELSRILLALKCALSGAGEVGTFIFDEIDSGIGGATADVVGQKLAKISESRQVISITHLPQIAAYGQRHFNVVKHVVGDRTTTRVVALSTDERVEELARMLGGLQITQTTRNHALELIERGRAQGKNNAEKSWPAG